MPAAWGVTADGTTDDTAALQRALDAAGQQGGGVVRLSRGVYHVAGHLNVPSGVTLEGMWESVPCAQRDSRSRAARPTDDGTTFLVTEGAGKEDGPPFITLNTNSTLKGVVLYYPEQRG